MKNHCGEVSKHIMLYGDWVRDSFKTMFVSLVRRKQANIKDVLVAGGGGCLLI